MGDCEGPEGSVVGSVDGTRVEGDSVREFVGAVVGLSLGTVDSRIAVEGI